MIKCKKTLWTNSAMNDLYDTNCIRPTQFSVIQIVHCNV